MMFPLKCVSKKFVLNMFLPILMHNLIPSSYNLLKTRKLCSAQDTLANACPDLTGCINSLVYSTLKRLPD